VGRGRGQIHPVEARGEPKSAQNCKQPTTIGGPTQPNLKVLNLVTSSVVPIRNPLLRSYHPVSVSQQRRQLPTLSSQRRCPGLGTSIRGTRNSAAASVVLHDSSAPHPRLPPVAVGAARPRLDDAPNHILHLRFLDANISTTLPLLVLSRVRAPSLRRWSRGAPPGIGDPPGAGDIFAPLSYSGPGQGVRFRERGGDGGSTPPPRPGPPRCHPDRMTFLQIITNYD
jgi:hypothetical protein